MFKKAWVIILLLLPLWVLAQYNPDVDFVDIRIFKVDDGYEVSIDTVLDNGGILTSKLVYDSTNPPYVSPYPSYLYKTVRIANDSLLWNDRDEMTIFTEVDYSDGVYELTYHGVSHWDTTWVDNVQLVDTTFYGNCTNAAYLQVGIVNAIPTNDPSNYGIYLKQNYPNPFNPTTTISYSVSNSSLVSLHIADMTGRVIKVFSNEQKNPGTHSSVIDASGLASGNYIYFLRVDNHVLKKVFTVLK